MEEHDTGRQLGVTLLSALYLFFFLISASTFGNPFPFFGRICVGLPAKVLVFVDSLLCLYLVFGIMKGQLLTWYLMLVYNLLQIANTIFNLNFISLAEIETIIGGRVNRDALWTNNMVAALGMMLLTQYVFRHKNFFQNRERYLF